MRPDARTAILARIRDALTGSGRIPIPRAAEAPRRQSADAAAAFVSAALLVNAHAEVVTHAAAIGDRLVTLCRELNAASVQLSHRAATMPWRLGETCAAAGLRVATPPDSRAGMPSAADVAVTVADYALADTGTIVSLASAFEGRLDSVLAPIHVAIVPESVILPDMWALFAEVSRRGSFVQHSSVVLITGPSRTADIELTLTIGVHGPANVTAFVVKEHCSCAIAPVIDA